MDIKLLQNQTCPKRFPDPRPKFNYPDDASIRDMAVSNLTLIYDTQ